MTNRTYAELLDRIEALAGKDSFTVNEQTRILSLANARLYSAYRRSDYWPRYLVIGEPRYTEDNTVPFTQASVAVVSGAGTTDANGTYQPIGTAGGKTLYALNGDAESCLLQYDSGALSWDLLDSNGDRLYADTGGSDPWDSEYSSDTGAEPAPTVTEGTRSDVDTFLRLYSGVVYGPMESGYELDMFVDNDGAHPTNTSVEWNQLYCTYKSKWGGPYLAASTDIPQEFFEYAAVGVLADWLRSNGNFSDARIASADADTLLDAELMTKQVQYNARVYAPRFQTYISRQNRNF